MDTKKNVYCGGIGCHSQDRKFNCSSCGVNMCSLCKITEESKTFCINCYVSTYEKIINNALDKVFNPKPKPYKFNKALKKPLKETDSDLDFIHDNDFFSQKNNKNEMMC
jgi:hypothetical protein